MTLRFRIGFPAGPDDYLAALSRGRWRREFEGPCAGLEGVLEVADLRSLPMPGSGAALAAAARAHPGADVFAMDSASTNAALRWTPPPASTLRGLEAASGPAPEGSFALDRAPDEPPVRFRSGAGGSDRPVAAAGFRVFRVPATFGVREEILARIPATAKRLLDVGCGAGETAGEARRRIPGLRAVGIDRDPALAAQARGRLDEVLCGDAADALAELAKNGASFDSLVLADFLEHSMDPHAVLEAALRLAEPDAALVVSVPNAASLPVIEDLLLGRFDPVAAGPEDAGHLRWFTRRLLVELLESVGVADIRVEPLPVPSDGAEFLARLQEAGVPHDPEELTAIQWLATGRAAGTPPGT